LNHAAIDSGIPRESATQRLGITQLVARRCRWARWAVFHAVDWPPRPL